eukprot:197803_1
MASKVLKEGWLQKKSRHIRVWRKRWVVITLNNLITYKTQEKQEKTELFDVEELETISSTQNDGAFCIKTNDKKYIYFKCDKISQKQEWINNIKIFINCIKIPINIECERNADYQSQFELSMPYYSDYDYSIDCIINDIIQYMETKFRYIKFTAIEIKSDSFIGQKIIYNDYDWNNCFVQI